jgi:hypothetical protein
VAIALVTSQKAQAQTATGATSFPVALPAGATAGNLVVLAVVYFGGTPAATFVTDNTGSNTWAQAGVWKTTGGGDLVGLFYAANVIAATKTITVHYSAAMTRVTLCAAEFSGVATSSPLDATNSGTGSSRTPNSGTITPAAANELFLFVVTGDSSTTIATVTGWTNLGKEQSTSTFGEMGFDFLVNSGSTALGVNQTNLLGTSTAWACMVAAFKVAGGTNLSFTGSGTAATSGTAAPPKIALHVAGSGTAATSGIAVPAKSLHVSGSGTAATSGAAAVHLSLKMTGAGTAATSGTATAKMALKIAGAGAANTSGTAASKLALHLTGSGTALTSGAALTNVAHHYAGAGTALTSGHAVGNASLHYTGTGTAFTGGSASVALAKPFIGSGVANTSGTAAYVKSLHVLGQGSALTSGAAIVSNGAQRSFLGSGTAITSGAAVAAMRLAHVGSGAAVPSGTASVSKALAFAASGTAVTSGTATVASSRTFTGSGIALSSGSATVKAVITGPANALFFSGWSSSFSVLIASCSTAPTLTGSVYLADSLNLSGMAIVPAVSLSAQISPTLQIGDVTVTA